MLGKVKLAPTKPTPLEEELKVRRFVTFSSPKIRLFVRYSAKY
jgi:hypothetical protein